MDKVWEIAGILGNSAAERGYTGLIADILMGLIILLFALIHAKRGLYRSVVGVIVFVLAIAAGVVASNLLTPVLQEKLWPPLEQAVSRQYDAGVSKATTELQELVGSTAEKLLSFTHLDDDAKGILDESAAVSWAEAPKAKLLELVNTALQEVIHGLLFLLVFLVGLILFKPLCKLVGKVTEAPVLHQLDWLGGFVLGALEGMALLFIVIKICELRDVAFFRDIQDSWFVGLLMGR